MSIFYKIRKIFNKHVHGGKTFYTISLLSGHNKNVDDLAVNMNAMSSFSEGDVTGLVDNLSFLMAMELSGGNTVTLDGIGTFSLSAELDSPVDDPEQITGKNIRLKRVCFKPAPEFKRRIEKNISFERLPSDMIRWRR